MNTPTAEIIRISVNLPSGLIEAARQRAMARGTTLTEVIRRALLTEEFLEAEAKKGAKLLLEDPDGKFRQVVLR